MATLSTHIEAGPDHGRLRFRADCPICLTERLSGTLNVEQAGHRRSAALMVALLSASALTPVAAPVAVADEASEVSELERLLGQIDGGAAPGEDEQLSEEENQPDPPEGEGPEEAPTPAPPPASPPSPPPAAAPAQPAPTPQPVPQPQAEPAPTPPPVQTPVRMVGQELAL